MTGVADHLPNPLQRNRFMLALDFVSADDPSYGMALSRFIHAEIGGEHILHIHETTW